MEVANAHSPEAEAHIEKAIADFLHEIQHPDPSFEVASHKEQVTVWKSKAVDESGIYKVKFVGRIPFTQDVVLKVMFDNGLRKAWDTVIDYITEVETLPSGKVVLHIATKSPVWGVAARDFVHIRTDRMIKENERLILDVSGKHEKCPEQHGFVRAISYVSGGLFENYQFPDPVTKTLKTGTQYTMVSQVDFAGIIPKMIVNMVASKTVATWFDSLTKACENYVNGQLKPVA
eukprot:TRINITY_DN1670_c0_g1_i2.p1 TRINITY_DN1670_c0_g1~~TRINITY_DN1670_c0_g1_i2.p1  ORF type:complete len:267 (-),score=52.97 TRINITY_DN1670_c0_g1_i2:57-752(-)